MDSGRSPMHVVISTESHDGWRHFCAVYGTNVTAMVEAIGLTMGQLDMPESKLPPMLRTTLHESRRIAAERAARRRHED